MTRGFPNGTTRQSEGLPSSRYAMRRTEGTETSEYLEEEKTTVISPVVASDRGTAQTVAVAMQRRGSRTTLWHTRRERNCLESQAAEGESPLREASRGLVVS